MLRAWRRISGNFDSQGLGRERAVMTQLRNPGFFEATELDLTSAIHQWEGRVRTYERSSGNSLPGDVKCSIHVDMAKGPLHGHMVSNASTLTDYTQVRSQIWIS